MLRAQDRIRQSEQAFDKAAALRRKINGAGDIQEAESPAEAEAGYDRLNLWMLW